MALVNRFRMKSGEVSVCIPLERWGADLGVYREAKAIVIETLI